MITISKKLIASILIIAMIITNSGVSVFADSVSNIVQKENEEKIQGLQKVSVNNTEGIYYFNNDSTLYCGLMKDENNNLHYFGINGKMLTNTTLSIGTTQFVINENGEVDQNRFSTGYIIINGQIRCFNPYNGRLMF